ncbi:L-rhamnonate dehydratase [Maioricimonas rarisocia]|uniref:L-rhamnonate dehydratase n=1 Tax=Maioricimonas rarisocia TaxID=2528026 RepID=A0A517Z9A8_9PLAN|nr:mandelate racemase/muconate lactonizing enzyme family protein [Maioricimonas rarisocia]QDU39060.1 L-rhamnonate dehydratase [Maioricimonas rarisocia]
MTITRVHAFQPIADDSPADWRTSLGQIAVRIETSDGLIGYGVGGGGAAGIHIIESILAPLLQGQSIEPVEDHWQAMYDATLPFGRKGVAIMALSGVDLALWDLRAKAADKSVVEWLGGTTGQAIPTYSTVWDDVDDETARGSSPVKLHVHPRSEAALQDRSAFIEEIVSRTAAAREAIGPERELMIDAWMEWDVPMTLAVAREIEPLQVGWIEEPISPDDLDGYRQLRDECSIPIAGGEHEFTHIGFRPLIEERLHRVLQPDVCWCGGMTELVRIYRMADGTGLRVIPHRGAEVWGLHALAALDPRPLAESGRPWMHWVAGQPSIEEEVVRIPDAAGFGVTLD